MSARPLPQSHARFPITCLLGSVGNVRVLRALIGVGAPQSAPEVASSAGLTPQGARLVLEVLVESRLVVAHGSGRTVLYAMSATHPLAPSLRTLFGEESRRWDGVLASLRKILDRQGAAVIAGWLYGSVARGEDTSKSDLDLAVVVRSQAIADRIRDDLMPLEDKQHIHVSVTALLPAELVALPEGDPWWRDVVRDGRVLKGSAPEQTRRRLTKHAA